VEHCISRGDGAPLLPACGEKVGMRGLMRFGKWERLWLVTALPLTRPASLRYAGRPLPALAGRG